jgi:hypothetical protein
LWLADHEKQTQEAVHPIARYRAVQQWLKALANLLSAIKGSSEEREMLKAFLQAECESGRNGPLRPSRTEPLAVLAVRQKFRVDGDIFAWIDQSRVQRVRAAADFVVAITPIAPGGVGLRCTRKRREVRILADWELLTLEEALRWMFWFDQFSQHPIICCPGCTKVFRPRTNHARKYCSGKCAHRVTGRNWQRRKRKSATEVARANFRSIE